MQVVALDNANLSIRRGEFVAITGLSGSGKSTLLHCLAGLDIPSGGQSHIAGRDITGVNDNDLTRMRHNVFGFIFQSFNLLLSLNAEENIPLSLRLTHRSPDKDWYDAIIATLGIKNRLAHHPSELSDDQQQRTAVARTLAGRPEVVFVDEPADALDSESLDSLLRVLAQMCGTLGQTVAMVTHDENAVAAINCVMWLRDGRIIDGRYIHHGGTSQAPPPKNRPVAGRPRRQGEAR